MRTTIRLEDSLLQRAKAHAAASGRSLNDFIADAVRAALAPRARQRVALELPTFGGHGLQPGVDLDDSAALLDLMDSYDGLSYATSRNQRRAPAKVAERPPKRR